MKTKLLLKCLLAVWLTNLSFSTFSQKSGECSQSCFETRIQEIVKTSNGCKRYSLIISNNGGCAHALSHYTVDVPCGTISGVSNSQGWVQEIGITDPTTGLSGFKIDDISGFGENAVPGSFTVDFTVCGMENSCPEKSNCWAPQVAYKAGQCVYYEQTELSCNHLSAHLDLQHVTCFGAGDGQAAVVIEEGESPFTYAWSNDATDSVISGMEAGEYTVTITDASGEVVELTAKLNEPEPIESAVEVTPASCSGADDGNVTIFVTGGTGSLTYDWSNGVNTKDLKNVAPGYYKLTITDSVGCMKEVSAVVGSTIDIMLTGLVQKTACGSASGSVDLSVSGGSAPYSYSWSNGATTEDITSLGNGMYTVKVTDANGCSANKSFFVNENNPLSLSAVATKTACIENNSGSINLSVNGGVEPLTYLWSNGVTTEDVSELSEGVYSVEVTDANGCIASLSTAVVAEAFQVSSDAQGPSCNGESDGFINLTPLSGQAPFTYAWSNGNTLQNSENLPGGLYTVTITDAAGCSVKLNFFLASPQALTLAGNIGNTNCTEGEFTLDVSVSGGTAPYTYSWSDGSLTASLDSLATGSYTVEVTDSKGCSASKTFTADATSSGCSVINNPEGDNNDPGDSTDDTGDDSSDGGSDDNSDNPGDGTDDTGDGTDDGSTGDDTDDNVEDGYPDDGEPDDDPDHHDGKFDENCDNPFDTALELVAVEGSCYTYKATIRYDGYHSYGLSHFSVEVPCGEIGNVSNTESWKVVYGADPTTSLEGFKIDNIEGFGEGNWPEEFDVSFTVCGTDTDCLGKLSDMNYTVAYKYGQCVSYTSVVAESEGVTASVMAYPNPFIEYTTIEFAGLPEGYTTVNIYNQRGKKVKQLFAGDTRKGVKYSFVLDGTNLPDDTYTYRISTSSGGYQGKIMLIR